MTQDKEAQAVKDAQAAAAKKGAEAEKSQAETQKLRDDAAEAGRSDATPTEYESYDLMPLSELQRVADERGVTINPDVLKAHLITELRAHQSGTTSVSNRRPV